MNFLANGRCRQAAMFLASMRAAVAFSPFCAEPPPHLGHLAVTGEPFLTSELCRAALVGGFGLKVSLRHELSWRPDGTADSRWVIPELRTGLYPADEGSFCWIAPGDHRAYFGSRTDLRWPKISGRWTLSKGSQGGYWIVGDDGWAFRYRHGQLIQAYQRSTAFEITASSGDITKLAYRNAGVVNQPITATFLALHRPLTVEFGTKRYRFHYGSTGQLQRVSEAAEGIVFSATYRRGLIASYWTPDTGTIAVLWREAEGFRGGRNLYPSPRIATRVGDDDYRYAIRGDVVQIQLTRGAATRTLCWNWLLGEDISNGQR